MNARSLLRAPAFAGLTVTLLCSSVAAQDVPPDKRPIPRVVADARVTFPKFSDDSSIAAGLGVPVGNLPGRGLGLVVGGHFYPVRFGKVTLGVGAELAGGRARQTLEPATEGAPDGSTVRAQLSDIAPQVSFNFGARDGWSYISGGMGGATLTFERDDRQPTTSAARVRSINYGGGARWFANAHLAFTLDARFYSIAAQPATGDRPAIPGLKMFIFGAGIGFR